MKIKFLGTADSAGMKLLHWLRFAFRIKNLNALCNIYYLMPKNQGSIKYKVNGLGTLKQVKDMRISDAPICRNVVSHVQTIKIHRFSWKGLKTA